MEQIKENKKKEKKVARRCLLIGCMLSFSCNIIPLKVVISSSRFLVIFLSIFFSHVICKKLKKNTLRG